MRLVEETLQVGKNSYLASFKGVRLSFEEGATVFTDPRALTIFDPDHSGSEDRWITMGVSGKGRLLIVVHTFQEDIEGAHTIRIISVRKASKHEIKQYGEWS